MKREGCSDAEVDIEGALGSLKLKLNLGCEVADDDVGAEEAFVVLADPRLSGLAGTLKAVLLGAEPAG